MKDNYSVVNFFIFIFVNYTSGIIGFLHISKKTNYLNQRFIGSCIKRYHSFFDQSIKAKKTEISIKICKNGK